MRCARADCAEQAGREGVYDCRLWMRGRGRTWDITESSCSALAVCNTVGWACLSRRGRGVARHATGMSRVLHHGNGRCWGGGLGQGGCSDVAMRRQTGNPRPACLSTPCHCTGRRQGRSKSRLVNALLGPFLQPPVTCQGLANAARWGCELHQKCLTVSTHTRR